MKTILVVDDSVSIRNIVSIGLSNKYTVVHAIDGVDAISHLKKQKIDLVLADLNMPNMGGIELIETIRSMDSYKFLPICVLTNNVSKSDVSAAKEAGAGAFMSKPFREETLSNTVQTLIG